MFKYDNCITNSLIITKYINKTYQYCAFKQTCTITADRNLFNGSTCDASITEYFQARWWCRPGMFIEKKYIKGLSNGIDKKIIIFNNMLI